MSASTAYSSLCPSPAAATPHQLEVGKLAIAISEDFNDILTIIQSQTEEVARNPGSAPSVATLLKQVLESTRHASALARQLRASPAPALNGSETKVSSAPSPLPAEPATAAGVKPPPLTIMVVDDDENICMIMAQVLQAHGFRVITANSADESLQIWRSHRDSLSLLITDINMPGGANGMVLGKTIQQEDASVPVIYTSGHRALEEFTELNAGVNYMPKPFGMQDLLKIVKLNLAGRVNVASTR